MLCSSESDTWEWLWKHAFIKAVVDPFAHFDKLITAIFNSPPKPTFVIHIPQNRTHQVTPEISFTFPPFGGSP